MRLIYSLIICFYSVFFFLNACQVVDASSDPATLHVRAYEGFTSQGIANATIRTNIPEFAFVKADSNGEYSFIDIPPGDYIIRAARSGGTNYHTIDITLESGEEKKIAFVF